MVRKRTTLAPEILLPLERAPGWLLREQLEERLRTAVRSGTLAPGMMLPSSRLLAGDLGLSRGVVVEAYAQLVAEGYLEARGGSATRVAAHARQEAGAEEAGAEAVRLRYNFRPGVPDLSLFPRSEWVTSVRAALRAAPDAALGYGDARGPAPLRSALSAYLGRVRGVVAHPERLVICTGFTQGLVLLGHALRAMGIDRVAVEDPSHPEQRMLIEHAGLRTIPVPVDGDGIRVDALARCEARAALVTPAHQFPLGVVLAPARRAALLTWARERDAFVIEDDYDAEYRYDRAPIGALQGVAPEHVLYAGSASKMLAPALRIGWLALPAGLTDAVAAAKYRSDLGSPVIEGLAFAHFLESGALDRHLRRVRLRYRARRDALLAALRRHIPAARVRGIAAGLHALVELPAGCDEQALVAEAARHGIGIYGVSAYHAPGATVQPALVLGYAALAEPAIEAGIAELGRLISAGLSAHRVQTRATTSPHPDSVVDAP
jgi:GntR family transcriptional regulator/MocR family aminotransferase